MGDIAQTLMSSLFGGDSPVYPLALHQIIARAAVIYILGVAIVRLGKSRLISRSTPLDVILGFILGSLLSRGITGHAAVSDTLAASAALVATHWLCTALACRSSRFEGWIKGHAYPLVQSGATQPDNMSRSHVSDADLLEAMRLQGIDEVTQIATAYKERNGEVSVIRRQPESAN